MNTPIEPRKVLFLLLAAAICASTSAQESVPTGMKYQAVVRDYQGNLLIQRDIVAKMQIVEMEKDILIWEELHYTSTNEFGLFQLVIGEGFTTGAGLVLDFESINWGRGSLAVQVDVDFGQGFQYMGAAELKSVPYSFLADSALKAPVPEMELSQIKNVSDLKPSRNQPLLWNGTQWLPGDSLKIRNLLILEEVITNQDIIVRGALRFGDSGQITGIASDSMLSDASDQTVPTSLAVKSYVDDSQTNELIQSARLEEKNLEITDAGGTTVVDLSPLEILVNGEDPTANDEIQNIWRRNDSILMTKEGGAVSLKDADSDPANELQQLSFSDNQLTIERGNTVQIPDNVEDADADPANELQDLGLTGTELSITSGNTVDLSTVRDGFEPNTDNQLLSISGNQITIERGNTITLPGSLVDADPDPLNEIQDISLIGTSLSITQGSTVDLGFIRDGYEPDTRLTEPEVDAFVANNGYITTESDPVFSGHPASTITALNILNWNTAFGWGDHAEAGYLTSYTETDPVFSASPAADITSGDINTWNNNVNYWNLNGSDLYVLNRHVGIGVSSPAASLHVANNDVVFTAPYSLPDTPGTPPVSGQGTRLMWYPDKAAFRFGSVQGANWDRENIGNYSFAGGDNPTASGLNSIALGSWSEASGENSVALGGGVALARNSIAFGNSAYVDPEASGAVAIGADANVYGVWATALGFQTEARGSYSTTMGLNTKTSGGGYGATAMGNGSEAAGHGSTAMGDNALANGETATATGDHTVASGDNSLAANMYTTSQSYASTVLGRYNVISGNTSSWIDSDPLFVLGNGSSSSNRNNAVTVYKNGNMDVDGSITADRYYGDGSGLTGVGGNQTLLQVLSTGNSAGGYRITNLTDPVNNQDAATKNYVDDEIDGLYLHYHGFDVDQHILDLESQVSNLEARISNIEATCCGGTGSGTVTDVDGNVYHTVTMGSQVWMGENLRAIHFNDGSSIPYVGDGTTWSNTTTPAYCWPNGSSSNVQPYGVLYNWYVIETDNICPSGWHVPTHADWLELTDYLGGTSVAGGKLKETGESHWDYPNGNLATDDFGFSAVGAGGRRSTGVYENYREYADFWTPDIYQGTGPIFWIIWYNAVDIEAKGPGDRRYATSIRCMKD